ncbi:nuclear pore complex protein Nup205 [Procambarus clarkii]|uniref:nuclear pore complex protein Nup205 n=1 Tax=Procambarus clarkii TaxID=6728 RepID=UPI001E676588|nr:nuclear pore complex protein Nup205-like [Procambarus clarkii]
MASTNKGMWASMVSLAQAVQRAVETSANSGGTPEALEAGHDLELALQRHRTSFISLLRNPPKNANERSTLQRSITEPMTLQGHTGPTKLSESFVKEAIIISDMFNMSEMSAMSLLRSAEEESTLYPGVPRGLIAILFYYDSRVNLAHALKTLVQARQGISWVLLPDNEELSQSITRYLQPILNISLVDRILELVTSMDITKEIELLQQNRALGDAKHRKMVLDKFLAVRSLLAETLFCWAAQTPFKKDECRRLLAYMSKVKLTETSDGSLDPINLSLLMALLYSLEAGHLLNQEDMTEALTQFPISSDRTFVQEIHHEVRSDQAWETPGLKAIVQLAWAVSLANLRQVAVATQLADIDNILEDDDAVLDDSLKGKVFSFIQNSILSKKNTPLDTFYCQRLHSILSDFIIHVPERVKAMKNRADENSRLITANLRESLQPPTNLDQPFEELLICLAALYQDGQCGELVEDYWCPSEILPTASLQYRGQGTRQMALFKFVRLPGDYLPPSLFVPYVNLLTSLATTPRSAQYVYNFLRMNSQPLSHGSNLAWEHFMTALTQYYNNLRIEEPGAMDTMYRARGTPRGITPQEVQGIQAVLQLVTMVAEKDELSRVALCDNAAWAPLYVCTGLLTCAVPLALKVELVNTLAAFSGTPALAQRVWELIEGGGLIPVQEGVAGYQPRGLLVDIEEVESSREEFTLTRAILKLLGTLVRAGIPPMLGAATRQPGFRPYLDLIRDRIFLRHDSRAYRDSGERWAVACGCLELLYQLLTEQLHTVTSTMEQRSGQAPGCSVLLDLVQESQLVKQVLSVLHDGVQILEQYKEVPGQKDLNASLLLVLQLLLEAQEQQHLVLGTSNNPDIVLGVERLLMGVNVHTGVSDHFLNVVRLVGHHQDLPSHAALACRLLTTSAARPSSQTHLFSLITSSATTATSVRHSFVEVIDHAALDIPEHLDAADAALNLLLKYLPLPTPNVAHFLLGYTADGMTTLRSDLLGAGARGYPRTAIHAVLASLPSCPPSLSEVAYRLVYELCSDINTSAPTLRFLRSSEDLLYRTVATMGLPHTDSRLRLLSQGWLLRCVALELRYHATHQQRSQLARLIHLLVAGAELPQQEPLDASQGWTGGSSGGRGPLLTLLDAIDLSIDFPAPLQCEYFTRASELIGNCESPSPEGPVVNLKMLHQQLTALLQEGGSGTSLTQRDPLQEELELVMGHALMLNQTRALLFAHRHFLEGWRQVVEVVVAVTPPDLIETATHHTFLHTLTHDLTRRLLDDTALQSLTTQLVSTLLMLVTTLRTLHARPAHHHPQYVSMLDSGNCAVQAEFPSSLQLVLRGLVECVARFKQCSQGVRASIYAALLNYLQICADPVDKTGEDADSLQSLLLAPRETQEEQFHRENYDVVRDELPQLVDVLAVEAGGGHHVCQVLALTCLSALAALEQRAAPLTNESLLLSHLADHGHLRRLLDALRTDDRQLLSLLTADDDDLRPLYVYEARMSLLARLALSPTGAQQLLQSGLTTRLSELTALDYRPAQPIQSASSEEFLPSVVQRYRSVLMAAIRVYLAILTSLGSDNYSATAHLLRFLAAHGEAFASGLCVPSLPSLQALEEVALLSAAVAGAAPPGPITAIDPSDLESGAQATRLQQLLIALLPHVLPQSRLSAALDMLPENEEGVNVKEMARTATLTTLAAVLNYATARLIHGGTDTRDITLVFRASMDNGIPTGAVGRPLSLATLVECASQVSHHFTVARSACETATACLQALESNQPVEHLRQYVSSALADAASPAAVRRLAEEHLSQVVALHRRQEQLAVHAAESAAFLLWRHLEYFICHAPSAPGPAQDDFTRREVGVPRTLTPTEIDSLRKQASTALQEVLPRLQKVHEEYSAATGHVAFLAAAITRIRRLLVP